MKLFARLFALYMSQLGYLDGKRNFPSEQDNVEIPVYCLAQSSSQPQQGAQVLEITQRAQLKEKGPSP